MTIDRASMPGGDTLAAIATNRFGFGARPGELAAARSDPRGWVLEALRSPYRPPAELEGLRPGSEVLASFLAARAERAAERRAVAREGTVNEGAANDPVKAQLDNVRQRIQPHYLAQAAARTRIAIASEASFRERLVHFWSNHFAVSIDKQICLGTAGALENEVIRPHLDGRFENLLLAVETHPAMITYLDNQRSMGPNSQFVAFAARRAQRAAQGKTGLNENLAREILELHTLGVDGGYTQADVTAFAAVITGWSIGGGEGRYGGGEPGAFVFRDALHEPGARTVLGRRYPEDGMAQGVAVLRDLAAHPATARHLSTKLARHFVGDEPPPALVDHLTQVYRAHDGHLPSVYAALVGWDGAWQSAPLKYKQPYEFIYSALRGLGVAPQDPKALLASFEVLGQRHWSPGSPAGWPDRQADWDGADALMQRIQWSVAVADRVGDARPALDTADASLGPLTSAHTREALARASSGSQAIAMLLMSPEFQRR
jgi:uncharacterized protein (DUF1800 family)